MLGKSICILLSAKAGVGKSTSAKYLANLAEKGYGYSTVIAPFATGVKQVARDSFGWNGLKDEKGRKLLQDVGQTGRNYDENIWVRKTMEEILPASSHYPYDVVLSDDWRFPNEADYIRKLYLYNLYTIRLVCPEREILKGTPLYDDVSETSLDKYKFDYAIDVPNFDTAYSSLQTILEDILSKQKYFGGK